MFRIQHRFTSYMIMLTTYATTPRVSANRDLRHCRPSTLKALGLSSTFQTVGGIQIQGLGVYRVQEAFKLFGHFWSRRAIDRVSNVKGGAATSKEARHPLALPDCKAT